MSSHSPPSFSIHRMSAANVDQALHLCREAGWNQLRDDWQRLISYEPNGCFVATSSDILVGTATTTRYGVELAWIGMMLVNPEFRRQGVATALMQHSIEFLQGQQVKCIKLDATPDGAKVYEQLGFETEWTYNRWCREGLSCPTQIEDSGAQSILTSHARELDRSAFGADRNEFVSLLANGSFVQTESDGYGMSRPGFLATYLGPVVASSPTGANSIICKLCERTERTIIWDIPGPNLEAVQMARDLGFTPVRDLTRMRLGHEHSDADIHHQYALADPGTG